MMSRRLTEWSGSSGVPQARLSLLAEELSPSMKYSPGSSTKPSTSSSGARPAIAAALPVAM
jgi:hypothetical protein